MHRRHDERAIHHEERATISKDGHIAHHPSFYKHPGEKGLHFTQQPEVSLCGYLKKQSPSLLHRWQKRYFIFLIDDRAIAYYKDKADIIHGDKKKGSILINDIHGVESKSDTQFTISTPDRQYNLEAPSQQAKIVWMDSLNVIKQALRSSVGADRLQVNEAIEKSLRSLSRKEGVAMAESHDPKMDKISTVDVHGHEHHGYVIANPEEKKVVEVEKTQAMVPERTEVYTKEVKREGDLIVEKENLTITNNTVPAGDQLITETTTTTVKDSELPGLAHAHSNDSSYYSEGDERLRNEEIPSVEGQREFYIVEKFGDDALTERAYRIKANRNNEVNIKFGRVERGTEEPSGLMRDFYIRENVVGDITAEKNYHFQAPRDNEVSFKFVRSGDSLLHQNEIAQVTEFVGEDFIEPVNKNDKILV